MPLRERLQKCWRRKTRLAKRERKLYIKLCLTAPIGVSVSTLACCGPRWPEAEGLGDSPASGLLRSVILCLSIDALKQVSLYWSIRREGNPAEILEENEGCFPLLTLDEFFRGNTEKEKLNLRGDTIVLCATILPAELEKLVNYEWLCADGVMTIKAAE